MGPQASDTLSRIMIRKTLNVDGIRQSPFAAAGSDEPEQLYRPSRVRRPLSTPRAEAPPDDINLEPNEDGVWDLDSALRQVEDDTGWILQTD
mmetsp:Transcript_60980/g.144105  ORF Transcript_60980/g.144105 Transcript_60980/m.144105 type:complete len:92 (-) Transcript_60980:1119-1394(-)